MDPAEYTDEQLVLLARHGQHEAFDELFRRHHQAVFRVATRIVGNEADGEEIVQEVFLRVARALPGFEPRARFSTWVHRIAVNRALSHRRRGREGRLVLLRDPDGPSPAADPFERARGRELGSRVVRAVGALPGALRAAFVLCALEQRPYAEAAEILELPVGTVKTHVHRARLELRRVLGAERGVGATRSEGCV